jgi:glycosyltransferase involved in cell wall biosynthesis
VRVVVAAPWWVVWWPAGGRAAPAGPEWSRYREAVRAGLQRADAIVSPTAAMRSALRRHYNLAHRCRVIPNGVSAHPAPAGRAREPLVLGAGRLWDEAKGLDTLDAAAAGLRWPVMLAGATGGREARHARLLGELDRPRLRACMGRAPIFAHPARYEPFGLAVLEAALAGCALVLGDIDSLREQWDGVALFVAPGDAGALRAALTLLIEDPATCRGLADAAQRRARRRHACTSARAYVNLYAQLCARHRVAV